jgi:hypothetical protein
MYQFFFCPIARVLEAAGKERGNTHKVQGLLASVYIRKNFFQLMAFQALSMLERAHHVLLERLPQLVFLRI